MACITKYNLLGYGSIQNKNSNTKAMRKNANNIYIVSRGEGGSDLLE